MEEYLEGLSIDTVDYESLVRSLEEGIWQWNWEGDTLTGSENFWRIMGEDVLPQYPCKLRRLLKRVHGDDLSLINQTLVQHIEQRVPYEITIRIAKGKSDWTWIYSRGQILKDVDGNAVGMWGIVRDVSQHRQIEKDLIDTHQLFQGIFNHLPIAISARDAETLRYTLWNSSCEQLFGHTATFALGKTDYELFSAYHADAHVSYAKAAIASGQLLRSPEEGIITIQGEPRIISHLTLAIPRMGDGVQWVLDIAEDITDHRTNEVALLQKEREFRSLADHVPDCIIRYDFHRKCSYINPHFTIVTGKTAKHFIGQMIQDFELPEKICVSWQKAMDKAFATGQEQSIEFEFETFMGVRNFYASFVPEYNDAWLIDSVLMVMRDITELHRAQNALLYQAEREYTLRIIGQNIRKSLNIHDVLETTVMEIHRTMAVDRTLIIQMKSDSPSTIVAEAVDASLKPIKGSYWQPEKMTPSCLARYADGQPCVISQLEQQSNACTRCLTPFMTSNGIQSLMIIPIIQGHLEPTALPWGLLVVSTVKAQRWWQTDEVELLQQVADQLAIALHHSQLLTQLQVQSQELSQANEALRSLNLKLKSLSNLDGLTKIANRRCFDECLALEWRRLQRRQEPLSLILFDVDHFKVFNDTYGHPAGDQCLIRLAQAVKGLLKRPTDLIARYGGEEFVLILANTSTDGAIQLAEQICRTVQALAIPHLGNEPGVVTISLGVASGVPSPPLTPATLIQQADTALYRAKATGRNCWTYQNLAEGSLPID